MAATDPLGEVRAAADGVTPARVFLDGPGSSYSTTDLLRLRSDHAAARDAVSAGLEVDDPALADLVGRHGLLGVRSRAASLEDYLRRPHLGREFDDASRTAIAQSSDGPVDLQLVLGDGLSPRAVAKYGPAVFELLIDHARRRGWTIGRPLFVSRCRVGIINEIGELTGSTVVVLLIGERPGLATGQSMSAYLGYRPRPGQTDADRNLVCNIHDQGVGSVDAARRVFELAVQMGSNRTSGVSLKEIPSPGPEITI